MTGHCVAQLGNGDRCTSKGTWSASHKMTLCTLHRKIEVVTHFMSEGKPPVLAAAHNADHYKSFAIEPIQFIQANNLEYRVANVVKYVVRHKLKNGKDDLLKARTYIDFLLEDYKENE